MGAIVLGWDPDRGTRWVPPYDRAVSALGASGPVTAPWDLGRGRVPAPGTQVYLMLQGRTRGLVGRGVVRSAPFRAGSSDLGRTLGTHVLIEWDRLLPIDDRIPCERLANAAPCLHWADSYGDVLELPDSAEEQLDLLWTDPRSGVATPALRVLTLPMEGARALAGHLGRVLTADR